MSFMYFEGTKDYIFATPALITTFEASGSITAGRLVSYVGLTDQRVYQPPATTLSGSLRIAGLSTKTVSNGEDCPVVVWGYCKNIKASATFSVQTPIVISGAGYVGCSGSPYFGTGGAVPQNILVGANYCGRYITGSTTAAVAFINCMGP